MSDIVKNRFDKRLVNVFVLAALAILILLPLSEGKVFADDGELIGANIKDGVLKGYYGPGGDIVIPNTVTAIDKEAFLDNKKVTSVTIPGSVSSIGYKAFKGCRELKKVIFSDSADGADMTIRLEAFAGCPKLEEATIPACAKYVTGNVFKGSSSLKEIKVDPGNKYYRTKDGVLFGPNVIAGEPQYNDNEIVLTAYPAGKEDGKYRIPDKVAGKTVKRLWAGSFAQCKNLKQIDIPDNVEDLSGYTFVGSGLTSVKIPETVKEIGAGTFEACADLTDAELPSTAKKLEQGLFEGCTSLQRVKMDSVNYIDMNAFKNCTSLTNLVLPESIKKIEVDAFKGCKNLERAYLPAGVTGFPRDAYVGYFNIFTDTSPNLLVYVIKGSEGEKYATAMNKSAGIKFKTIDGRGDLDTTRDGAFHLMDMGKKVKLSGEFNMGTSLDVNEVKSGKEFEAFKLVSGEKKLKVYRVGLLPKTAKVPGSMELAIGIPVGTDGKDAALYRLNGDRAEKVEAEKLSKTLKTTVDSLGYFAVIGKNDESVVPDLPVDPQTIKLNKEKVRLKVGKTVVLSSTVGPDNAKDKSVTWKSSDESVATVVNGVVTAKNEGITKISATTVNGLSAECEVTVTAEDAVTAKKASVSVEKKLDGDNNAVFNFSLEDASNIAMVEMTFSHEGSDMKIEAGENFKLLGAPVKNGDGSHTAVLTCNKEGELFSADGTTKVATIKIAGKEQKVTLKEVKITGWGKDKISRFGTIESIDKETVAYKPISKYDINEDGSVDKTDLDEVRKNYRVAAGDPGYESAGRCDVNEDGVIDVQDLIEVKINM